MIAQIASRTDLSRPVSGRAGVGSRRPARLRALLLKALALAVLLAAGPLDAAEKPASAEQGEQSHELAVRCPVMPRRQAVGEFSLVHEGRTVYFCCEECVAKFRDRPAAYVANLPGAEKINSSALLLRRLADNQRFLAAACGTLLCLLLARSWWRRAPRVAVLLLIGSGAPLVGVLWADLTEDRRRLLEQEAREAFNFAVYHDFGDPPRPMRPPLPPRLGGIYYRGNDERTELLWNHGYYRTCTFELRVVDVQGRIIEHGATLPPGELTLVVDIVRAPFTAEHFWSPQVMGTMFFTRNPDPIDRPGNTADRVALTTLEPYQRYSARFPLGRVTGQGAEKLGGVVYVCEASSHLGITGARYHAAVQYDLRLVNGIVAASSDLFMGALYRTRRVPQWKLPLHEWFSHEPIPELPGPHQTTDATALGVSDYQYKIERGTNAAPAPAKGKGS
jgi:YHS domain-containing protein